MVLIAGKEAIQQGIASKKKLFVSVSLGIFCIIIPIICLVIDPLIILARTKLRIIKGGLIHEILKMEYKGLHIKIYVFNVTNGDQFLSGEDHKLKIQEVGPFVYQEYRKNEDIEILPEEGIFRYTSNMWAKFIPEESVGDPKEVVLNLPNMPLLSLTAMLSKFPPIIRNVYNLITLQQNAKPFVLKDVHSYLWNYTDPLVTAANRLIPGFIYFENIGILERLYDKNMVYRMELGATEEDKFQIKWVEKTMRARNTFISTSMMESNKTYVDTYEGMGYPPNLPPSAPRHVYRPGICKTVELQYIGSAMLDINTEGYKFDFNKRTFENKNLCDSKGYCPDGLLDLSECFFGIPVTLSRGHFNNSDPRLFDRIEGLSPDSGEHESYFYVEPKVGLIIEGKTSLQMNLVMRDVKYSTRVHRFTDMVLPMAHARVKTPPLPDLVQTKLELLFITCYRVQKVMIILSVVAGLLLLARAARLLYWMWACKDRTILFEKVPNPGGNVEAVLIY